MELPSRDFHSCIAELLTEGFILNAMALLSILKETQVLLSKKPCLQAWLQHLNTHWKYYFRESRFDSLKKTVFKQVPCAERVNMIWPSPRINSGEARHLKWTGITNLLWVLEFVQINNTWHTQPQVLSWSHVSYNWLIIQYCFVK